MSDVEYDYMSDEILGQCSKDVRPGLIQDRSKQRLVEIEKRKASSDEENKKRHKSQASLEAQRREEGLQEAIPADNKGFEILQKMGYKPGEAIGKTGLGLYTEAVSTGLWNIYDISVKNMKDVGEVFEKVFDSQALIFLSPQRLLRPATCCRARKVSHQGSNSVKVNFSPTKCCCVRKVSHQGRSYVEAGSLVK